MIQIEDKDLHLFLTGCFDDLLETCEKYSSEPTIYMYICCMETVYFIRGVLGIIAKSDRPILADKYLDDLAEYEKNIQEFTLSKIKKGECR